MTAKGRQEEEGVGGQRAGAGAGGGARSGKGSEKDIGNASMYAHRFQCSAETVHAFATGCRRKNDGIGSMCSRQEHEMEIGEDVYFYDGTSASLPTAYCVGMECFLSELHESTIFHACNKKLMSGMSVCLTCAYKSDIEGGMAQCEAEGHDIKTYSTKKEYEKENAQDSGEESHTFHAHQILQSQRFCTMWDTEAVVYYENGVYKDHGEVLVKMLAEKRVENCTTHVRMEILNTIRAITVVKRDRFDAVPGVINVKNGLLSIDGMEFREHDADHLSRTQLNTKYSPEARAPKFEKFLEEVLPGQEDRETLMEVLSTSLVGSHVNLEKILMFLGEGHNGKSTLLEVIAEVIGPENISHVSIHQIIEERFARAELDGKLVNIYADISGSEITNLGVVKSLVTGEPVMAEFKGQQAFALRNKAKLVFSANRLPDIAEDSDAVFRRFIIIPFPSQFDGAKENPNLKKELTTEAEKSGVLNLLLESLKRVIDNGGKLTHEMTIDSMRDMWRVKSDPIKRFTMYCLRKEDDHHEDKDDVYQAYVRYCEAEREQPSEKHLFSRRMGRLGYRYGKARVGGRAVNAWYGVRIVQPDAGGSDEGGSGGGGGKEGGGLLGADGGGGDDDGGGRKPETGKAGAAGGDLGEAVWFSDMARNSDGAGRPGGRDGIVLDVLDGLCKEGGSDKVQRAALIDELGKTGMFPLGRDVDDVMGRLVEGGWIVDESAGSGKGEESGGDGDAVDGSGGGGGGSDDDGGLGGDGVPSGNGGGSSGTGAGKPAPVGGGGGKRRFRCQTCPAGPFDEDEVGFAGKRLIEYHAGKGHRIEWESAG